MGTIVVLTTNVLVPLIRTAVLKKRWIDVTVGTVRIFAVVSRV